MAEVPHPCVADTSCATNFFAETDPLSPNYGKLIPRDQIDPDPCNILECRPGGLFVPPPPLGTFLFDDVTATNPAFVWAWATPPAPASPVLVASASLSVTVPGVPGNACAVGTARITARVSPCSVFVFNTGDGAEFRFEVTAWQVGALSGGPTVVGTAAHYAGAQYASLGWPTFTQTGPVSGGDILAVSARLLFWGYDAPGPGFGTYYAALATPTGPNAVTITLDASTF